jgi:nucleotide-binding universal stress UspA family protein
MTSGRVVVFGDHTPAAALALRWAVLEATRRDASVVVVRPFALEARADLALETDLERARRDSRYRTQSWVIEAVADLATSVSVAVSTPDGSAAQVLVAAAKDADLVVIGADGVRAQQLADAIRPLCGCPVQVGAKEPTAA